VYKKGMALYDASTGKWVGVVLSQFFETLYDNCEVFAEGESFLVSAHKHARYADAYLIAPFSEIKRLDQKMYRELFIPFCELFPDHPDEGNTGLVVTYSRLTDSWEIWFVCSHFEHSSFDDLIDLQKFMIRLARYFNIDVDRVCLGLLEGNAEAVILEVYMCGFDIKRGARLPSWMQSLIRAQLCKFPDLINM